MAIAILAVIIATTAAATIITVIIRRRPRPAMMTRVADRSASRT
jgi:hypothetical protein